MPGASMPVFRKAGEKMGSRVGCLVASLVLSLVSTGVIATTVYPRWMKTYAEALVWGLTGSALFLAVTLMLALAVVANREAPLPTSVVVVLVLLLGAGVVLALLWTVMVGL